MDAEFLTAGTLADLTARYDALHAAVQTLLAGLADADLNRPVTPPPEVVATPEFQQFHGSATLTVGYCFLHIMQHCALHAGHMQLTLQLLAEAEEARRAGPAP